ncbi:hypothetical protein PLESTB_000456600 [Pleodorina starrii]|uniref:Uncharacterized protein n=1 Tax=Pleodorina starrii TaxID=330485 RepID=A0A9W6EZF7_9CHLO|nr:hypothetical protein PLESTM_000758100 [Pleodorina starrii]GLC51013.1 hypothetical protein PLESTB_000456600 [Pleodorina starrii]
MHPMGRESGTLGNERLNRSDGTEETSTTCGKVWEMQGRNGRAVKVPVRVGRSCARLSRQPAHPQHDVWLGWAGLGCKAPFVARRGAAEPLLWFVPVTLVYR